MTKPNTRCCARSASFPHQIIPAACLLAKSFELAESLPINALEAKPFVTGGRRKCNDSANFPRKGGVLLGTSAGSIAIYRSGEFTCCSMETGSGRKILVIDDETDVADLL